MVLVHGLPCLQYRRLYPVKLPKFTPVLKSKGAIHKCSYDNKYSLPFLGADKSVMERSQRYLFVNEEKRPVQVNCYFCVGNLWTVFRVAFLGMIVSMFAKFKCGRKLLFKHPKFFTSGYFSKEGPSDEKMENMKFTTTLIGDGWPEKHTDPKTHFPTKPTKRTIAQVNGTNPAYGATCMTLTVCALTILDDLTKLPKRGGVFSPGAAFYHTDIIKEMHENGLTF